MPFAVGGVREKWGRGIDCSALTMRVEGLRERLQQLRCRARQLLPKATTRKIHRAAFRRTSLRQKPLPRMMMWRGKQLTSIGNSVTTDKLPIGAFGAGNAYLGFHAASAIAAQPAKTMTGRGVIEKVNPPRKQFAHNWLDS
jgi:hypothetical protein